MKYGVAENYQTSRDDDLLPIGISEGCRLKADVKWDQVLTYSDVELPTGSTACDLRREQDSLYASRWNVSRVT
jgi:predicted homoserine dehydrogenase-like protein